ncbi:MAG TPA: hypothetical protein VGE77_07555 [Nocardioides sp.]
MTVTPPAPYGPPPVPPARRASVLPWVLVALLLVVFLVLGALLLLRDGGGGERRGFATPEEAIEFATERLADGDADGAVGAWASEEQAAGLDLAGYLERLQTYPAWEPALVPGDDDFFREIAETARAGGAADQYRRLVVSLLLPEVDLTQGSTLGDDGPSAQEIAEALDSSRLESLRAQRIERVEGPERLEEQYAESARLVGAEERREYLVLYEWDGDTYLGAVGLLRYGDEWRIDTLSSPIANVGVAALEPATDADLDEALEEIADRDG